MTVNSSEKKSKIRERLLLGYLRRNTRLALILSTGALILVLIASSSGAFCYFVSKKSMSLAAKESPVDVVFEQHIYTVPGGLPPYPHEFLGTIYAEPDVVNAYGLAALVLNLNVSVNRNDTGMHNVMILSASKKEGFNVTLSEGSQIGQYDEILVSEDFCEQFNVTLMDQIKLVQVTSRKPLRTLEISGSAVGITPKHFSQLTEELGLHDSLLLAGHTEAELLSFDQYPFVLVNMSNIFVPSFLDYASKHYMLPTILATFFVKFDSDTYLNPWDSDITISNLKEQAQNLIIDMNNLTSTRIGYEYELVSLAAVPAENVFQQLNQFINISRLTVIAFGATVAFVGWCFYSSVSQLALSARTRELQLMRIRGISQKSIDRTISLAVVASGVIGTAAGLLVGFVMTTNIAPSILNISITQADLGQTFGILSLMFYAFFGLAASLISQRQALSKVRTVTPRAEAGMEVQSKMGLSEKVALAIAFILGTIKVADWLLGFNLTSESGTANPITSAVMLFFRLIDQTILDALGALLLIYALVTILSRRPRILSTVSQWVSRALSPRLSLLSRKIMSVKAAKMAAIMIVASLLVFNTVSANMGYWGVKTAWRALSKTVVGADARIDMPEEASAPVIQLLNNTSGVVDYAQILTVDCGIGPPLGSSVIYAIDPERYAAVLEVGAEGLDSVKAGDILASEFFRDIGLLSIGDKVALGEEKELTVRGFIKSVPGLLSVPPVERFALISWESVEGLSYNVIARTLLLRLSGSQPDTVVNDLMSGLPENVRLKLSTATESQMTAKLGGRIAAPLIVESVISMLLIASVIGLVFAALALGVMGYSEAVGRRSLDGLLRVKGVNRRQLIGMALSEALSMLAISLIIGFFAGYAMANGYTSYFSAAFPINAAPALSYELVTQLLALTATYLVAFLAPVLYAMKKAGPIQIY